MSYRIDEIEGIGAVYREKLNGAGVKTTDTLLKHCGDRAGRKTFAQETGISEKLILKWTNKADLMRVAGVGPQYSDLLEAAGVDTVKELRTRNAGNLTEKMAAVNAEKKLARKSPSKLELQAWIDVAKTMEPGVTY